MENTSEHFYTADIGCASALVTAGQKIKDIDRSMSNRYVFVFEKNDKIDKISSDYWENNLKIDALGFFNSIKRLKNQAHSN